jgi:hypothetical protein
VIIAHRVRLHANLFSAAWWVWQWNFRFSRWKDINADAKNNPQNQKIKTGERLELISRGEVSEGQNNERKQQGEKS